MAQLLVKYKLLVRNSYDGDYQANNESDTDEA